jgi:predicted nucleotidyltransferase
METEGPVGASDDQPLDASVAADDGATTTTPPEDKKTMLERDQIEQYLREVGAELDAQGLTGEILITGGAYMTLVLKSRGSTKDVDAVPISDPAALRDAAATVAAKHGLPSDWLNDGVKGFIAVEPDARLWADYPGLRVYEPGEDYMFAMKVSAARPEDLRDITALRDALGLKSAEEALAIVERYIPARLLTVKHQFLVESLFEAQGEQ